MRRSRHIGSHPSAAVLKKHIPTLLGLFVLAGLLLGTNRLMAARAERLAAADADSRSDPQEPRLLAVEATRLERVDGFAVLETFTGTIQPARAVDLVFEGTGRVASVAVDDGDRVEAGQRLAALDTEVLRAERAEVAARRGALEATLAELEAGPRQETIRAARADVEAIEEELALAVRLRERREGPVERGTLPQEVLDSSRTAVTTAAARLDGARARLEELLEGTRPERIAAQRAALDQLDAALAAIDARISKTELLAPFAGTIEGRQLDEGAFVSSMAPRTAMRLVETGALEARIGLSADAAERLAGQASEARLEGSGGASLSVTRTRVLPTVDRGTRTVTAVLDLAAQAAALARPGEVVELALEARRDEPGAWVPVGALSASPRGLWSLYALADAPDGGAPVVERLEVEVLQFDGERAFVRGTFDGDRQVITSAAQRVVPGQRVRVMAAAAKDGADR